MVDGVLASCYTSVYHELAHNAMKPIQWFPEVVLSIFDQDDGFAIFAKIIKEFGESIIPIGSNFANINY